jgi:hypothetical protein
LKPRVLFFAVYLISMSAFAYLSSMATPTATPEFMYARASAALTVGSILIAVLGLLASLFVTQNLKSSEAGARFEIMIALIALGMALSFTDGIVGLYASSRAANAALVSVTWSLLVVAIYSTTLSVIASVVSIMKS